MKRLIFLFSLAVATIANAGQFTVQSFLNPNISALVISNNVGATNLNYIYQNQLQGVYLSTTNTLGTSINVPIATNTAPRMYSNSVPVTWYGQSFVGSLVQWTNNTIPAGANTNDVIYALAGTNNSVNFFQDVNLPNDYWTQVAEGQIPAAATATNCIAFLQIVSQPFSLYGQAAGGGSNQVTLSFVPIATTSQAFPGGINPIPGFTPDLEQNDAAVSGGANVWSITYTNQISLVNVPTVVNYPVPRWQFPCKGMRLRWAFTGGSTNAIAINSITLQSWTP